MSATIAIAATLGWSGIWSAALEVADSGDRVIIPGVRAGLITSASTMDDLVRIFGASHVQATRIDIGEGETIAGVVLFADDSAERIEIAWRDTTTRRVPDGVYLTGTYSHWHLANGITLGTALLDLERLNGRWFRLTGFDWDYSGTVTTWRGGLLARLGPVALRLAPGENTDRRAENHLIGEGVFSSAHPDMRRLNPRVYQLIAGLTAPNAAPGDTASSAPH